MRQVQILIRSAATNLADGAPMAATPYRVTEGVSPIEALGRTLYRAGRGG
jgi:hypothetical protein